jgi:hypothetical protein
MHTLSTDVYNNIYGNKLFDTTSLGGSQNAALLTLKKQTRPTSKRDEMTAAFSISTADLNVNNFLPLCKTFFFSLSSL